ncbi:MAG: acyl-CoA dehydrogenase family protein [Bdellovibrionia bacterium]
MNFYTDSSEWRYLFRNAIDWDTLIPLYHREFPTADGFQSKEELITFYEDLLSNTGNWTGNTLAARARQLDEVGGGKAVDGRVEVSEVLTRTYQEARDMDLIGLVAEPQYGGMGLPAVLGQVVFTQLSRACLSTGTQLGFHSSIADMIDRYCSEELKAKYIPRILKAEISGAMCMTEPDSGSDVGSLRTQAEKQRDGTYLLNGTKVFITNGGGGLGFVLARVKGAPQGLEGISMFFAEQWIDVPGSKEPKQNYRIAKVEHKMGMHGSITCEVVYENSRVHLVGKENEGFKMMLHLMNEARISVGLQGLGTMEAALGQARAYAETRKQFGKPIAELPLMKRNLQDYETERDAFRALMVDTMSYFDIYQKLHLQQMHTGDLNEKEKQLFQKASRVCRHRTPLVKYYGSEAGATISQKALQVLGGYGFMAEYDLERFHRDSFGALLYEGTSQIQALMALKDLLKAVMKNPARYLQSLVVSHPLGALLEKKSPSMRSVGKVQYEFRKHFITLLVRCFKPELKLSDLTSVGQVFSKLRLNSGDLQQGERIDHLMTHAETVCQALAYQETLVVLAKHATADPSRVDLFERYLKLITPRLEAIYTDWRLG